MLERARDRIRSSPVRVRIVLGRAEVLPFRDRTFDTAVSMLTLCSVADPSASVGELRRVLRDDGRLVVFEHGLAEDPKIVRWQHRLDPLNRVMACGCHLNRPVMQLIAAQGLQFETVRRFYLPKAPPTHGCFTMGVARKGLGTRG
jgi:ubiquinone/menaquinone biosynthesis C-methylase UbiE